MSKTKAKQSKKSAAKKSPAKKSPPSRAAASRGGKALKKAPAIRGAVKKPAKKTAPKKAVKKVTPAKRAALTKKKVAPVKKAKKTTKKAPARASVRRAGPAKPTVTKKKAAKKAPPVAPKKKAVKKATPARSTAPRRPTKAPPSPVILDTDDEVETTDEIVATAVESGGGTLRLPVGDVAIDDARNELREINATDLPGIEDLDDVGSEGRDDEELEIDPTAGANVEAVLETDTDADANMTADEND